ncbi:MAG TPA: hybrid sensor histidine kinase/response regulator [Polyangiaceae bacterium]
MSVEASSRDERVRRALVDSLYSQTFPIALGELLMIAAYASFQWPRQPHERLLAWIVPQTLAALSGAVCGLSYQRRARPGPRATRFWRGLYVLNTCALGLAWSIGSVAFFDARDLVGTSVALVFSGGLTAGTLIATAPHPRALVWFSSFGLVPYLALSFGAGTRAHTTIGVALGVFLLFSLLAARNLHRSFRKSIELGFDNEQLALSLKREKEIAERALAQKSRVLAAASHDLRQPLHALGMFIDVLDERLKVEEDRAVLGRIRASSVALSGLLNALLDISRLESDAVTIHREHFRLEGLFEQLAAEYGEIARRKGLAFRAEGAEYVVHSDAELVARMIRNLLSNALRFTARGEVRLSARRAQGGGIEVVVADTGPGILPEDRERIFDEFYQVGNAERDREQGLGLGLAIVRGLSRVLGHPVKVRSVPELSSGSEFSVCLSEGDPELAARAAVAAALPQAHGLRGRRILLIDDERDIREGLGALLRSWDCEAVSVGSLEEALVLWKGGLELPDIVLCDYRLRGGLTGADVLAELEASWDRKFISVIITGDTSPDRIREAKRSGRPVLFKPVIPGKLRALLNALVEPRRIDGA